MIEPPDRTAAPSATASRSSVWRVLGNAALLTFASLTVISVVAGQFAGALLWLGALLVLFAPALDRPHRISRSRFALLAQRADSLRWCGLAFAAAGAALLVG